MKTDYVDLDSEGRTLVVPGHLKNCYTNFEPVTTSVILRYLSRRGGVFVDVGANIGWFTVIAAQALKDSGMVYSIEANPAILPALYENISGFQNTRVIEMAAGNRTGSTEFYMTSDFVNSGIYADPFNQDSGELTEVKIDLLDNIVPNHDQVSVVKIDVQGDDLNVIEGAKSILSNSNLTMICEWAPAWMKNAGRDPGMLPLYLKELGFQVSVIDDWLGVEMSLDDFYVQLQLDKTGKRFCNLLATK